MACDVKLMFMILKLKLFRKLVEYHVISKTKQKNIYIKKQL